MKDRDRPDLMRRENVCKFCTIFIDVLVQFRAEHDHDLIAQEILMKVRVGKRDAVSRDEEVSIIKIRCLGLHEPELDRPMAQF